MYLKRGFALFQMLSNRKSLGYQYFKLVEKTHEVIDYLFVDYSLHRGSVIYISDKLNDIFQEMKLLIILIEIFVSVLLKVKMDRWLSRLILDLKENPEEIYKNWEEIKDTQSRILSDYQKAYVETSVTLHPYIQELCYKLDNQIKTTEIGKNNIKFLVDKKLENDKYSLSLDFGRAIITIPDGSAYELTTYNNDSNNYFVSEYLQNHVNEKVDKSTLEEAYDIKIGMDLNKLLDKMHFSGEIKKVFFNSSKETILYRKDVQVKELSLLGVNREELNRQIKRNRMI